MITQLFCLSEYDDDDEDDYNRTLKDVSLLEDFTVDDETPTTLPKDPFPSLSLVNTTASGIDGDNNHTLNASHIGFSLSTIHNVFTSDDQLAKALIEYNNNTPPGQETVMIPIEEEGFVNNFPSVVSNNSGAIPNNDHSEVSSDGSMIPPILRSCKRECRGYIRVIMNLRRPINVHPGSRPPSTYTIPSSRDISGTVTLTADNVGQKKGLTSFYLPVDTVKALHVTTLTSVHDVIRTLLSKFRVVDNPHKFALYEKISTMRGIMSRRASRKNSFTSQDSGRSSQRRASRNTLVRHNLRKMSNEERPLVIALARCVKEKGGDDSEFTDADYDINCSYFVLQENDPGEMISWESFSMPELKNFLRILDREEAWYKKRIHEKYEMVLNKMQQLIEEKRPTALQLESKNDVDP